MIKKTMMGASKVGAKVGSMLKARKEKIPNAKPVEFKKSVKPRPYAVAKKDAPKPLKQGMFGATRRARLSKGFQA